MKFYINDNFKKNEINKKNVFKLGYRLNKSIPLKNVKKIKSNYARECLQTLNKLEVLSQPNRKWYQGRVFKLICALVLFVGIIGIMNLTKIKTLTVIVDGETKQVRTKHFYTPIYVNKVKERFNLDDFKIDTDMGNFVVNDAVLNINSLKKLEIKTKKEKREISTYSNSLKEFLDEYNQGKKENYVDLKNLGKEDKILLKNVNSLNLVDRKVKVKDKEETIAYKTEYVEDKNLASGEKKVKQKGVNGKVIYTYENVYLDGKKSQSKKVLKKTVVKKKNEIILLGTKVSKSNENIKGNVWDRLAKCESGGNWHTNTGNGYYGGLQFSKPTWDSVASVVGVSASYPHLASKEDQIKAATYLQKRSGWGQWPACTSALGLR